MTKKNKLTVTGAISVATLGLALAGSTFAAAAQTTATTPSVKSQVTATETTKMDTDLQTKMTNAFTAAETAGKITAAQKATLLEKDAAIRAKMKAGDRDGAGTLIKEMHGWMTSNSIDASVMPKPDEEHDDGSKGHHSAPSQSMSPSNASTTK
jgi:hypothetical protein